MTEPLAAPPPLGASNTAPPPPAGASTACPTCGAEVAVGESFCEACGTELPGRGGAQQTPAPAAEGAVAGDEQPLDSPIALSQSVQGAPAGLGRGPASPQAKAPQPCLACGGVVGADGYCETCGTKAPSARDHYTEAPSSWVAASCDRGVRHHRNEDASAVASEAVPGSRAVLVVCDGVSTSEDSDVASLAGARAARDLLTASQPAGMGQATSRAAAIAEVIVRAAEAANAAVVDHTATDSANPASCTFSAAVVEGDLVVYGNVGDSRSYWLPDPGSHEAPIQLSIDDSMAQMRIAAGASRVEAEEGPQAHAILKWLGRDSPDFVPMTGSLTIASPGWVMVCSDGLWNYVSEASALQQLVADQSQVTPDPLDPGPLALAEALVAWANAQGGKDNITVALARHDPPTSPGPTESRAPARPAV
jgi:serine/threonine protein phosphatase PrpC